MNDEPQFPADAMLHRLLSTSIGPNPLNDEEIESLLNSTAPSMTLSDEQTQRIVGKVHRLLSAPPTTAAGNAHPMHPIDQHPRLVSATTNELPRPIRIPAIAALMASMLALVSVIVLTPDRPAPRRGLSDLQDLPKFPGRSAHRYLLTAKALPDSPPAVRVAVGDQIATNDVERRRVTLPDGSVLYVNSGSQVKIATERRVEVSRGEVFVEVVPAFANLPRHSVAGSLAAEHRGTLPFEVVTPKRTVTALRTKFSVSVDDSETDVMVTQGKVKVSGVDEVVTAGQHFRAAGEYTFASAPSASTELEWTRDLMAAASGPLVAKSEYSGGALVTVDPNGQSSRLSLRNYHIDVHIEDGFARTTIDQTYFNHTHSRMEGTFHFPLPTDASLSRLAMYVNGKLMEGGMAERDHARNTFEEIKRKMLDPALLEWVDGSTFKMRVFPLEPRQEKRIVLSYSQRLNSAEGRLFYRFPAGHSMDAVREWSAHVRVIGGSDSEWHSQSHAMTATEDAGNLVLDAGLKNALMDRDLVLRVGGNTNLKSQISNFKSEGQQYVMLRLQPELPGEMQRQPHHWVFLFEHAGDRSPLLARAQIEIIRTLLENAEHTDTFSIVSASTRAELYADEPQLCSADNIAAAVKYLENVHLVGALDLAAAFKASGRASALRGDDDGVLQGDQNAHGGLTPNRSPVLIHVGSGMPALGERDASKLAAMIPAETQYVGIGVGRRWNQEMMKLAASRTGGLSTQINPDEEIAWRAFDVFSKLHSPRLVNLAVRSEERGASGENLKSQISDLKSESPEFLVFSDTITQGEELAAICRIPEGQPLPESITVTATLNGIPWTQTIPVANVKGQATYLPRHWAKLEIDRLLAENAEQHRDAIVTLSKSMYVMSPYTSLLVLENEEMYTQYNIDRGRKDHWALYPCPEQIEVVVENTVDAARNDGVASSGPKIPANVMATIARIQRPQWFTWNLPQNSMVDGYYRMRGIQDVGLESENRSLNFWGRAQQQGNMWFDDTAVRFRFDADSDGDGLREGIWIDSLLAREPLGIDPVLANGIMFNKNDIPTTRGDLIGLTASGNDNFGAGRPVITITGSTIGGTSSSMFVEREFATFVDQYNDLLREKRFAEAELLAKKARDLNADSAPASLMVEKARLLRQNYFNQEFPARQADSFTRQLNDVDLAPVIPFGEYTQPDAGSWAELADRWRTREIANNGQLSQRELPIHKVLREKVSLHFNEATLSEVLRNIANEHGINIAMRTREIETEGLAVNPPVDIDVDGITLKSALNLLLDQAGGLAYSVEDETLMITTVEAANKNLESESLADMRVPALLFEDEMSPGERPSSVLSGAIELRHFGLPALQSGPGAEDRFSILGTEPEGRDVRLRFRTDNLSLRGIRVVIPEQQEVRITPQRSLGSHRWSADSIGATSELVALPTFQPPSTHALGVNAILFGDLISHAPGLDTSQADVMAVVEAECDSGISHLKFEISNAKPGRVDAAARALIEKSRSHGWESITLPGRAGEAGITVHYDGQGRHVWERVVSEGLREHVVCDGSTLWHVYREIGLASKRPFSRFHHREFAAIVPWLLPSAAELARGADVVAVDERTIAIVPKPATTVPSPPGKGEKVADRPDEGVTAENSASTNAEATEAPSPLTLALSPESGERGQSQQWSLHLVFATDGRLAERQIVEQASGKILHRITYDADGKVTVFDGDGKQMAMMNLHRSTAAVPQLVPDLKGMIVLPMPVRTQEMIVGKKSADLGQVGVPDADLSEDEAVSLMLASMASGNGARMVEIARKRFIDKGDTRDGIYVLLSRFPQALVQVAAPKDQAAETAGSQSTPGLTPPGSPDDNGTSAFDLRPPAEGSSLKQFVRQYVNWLRDGDATHEFRIDAPEDSFLQRMATARNLYVRWLTETATKDLTQAQVQQEVDRTLEFIASCRTLEMGWSLMSVMRPRLTTPEFLAAYANAAQRFEQHPQIGLLVRRERMTALFAAGKQEEGRNLFREWLFANLEQGFVPPIGTELYNACISNNGQKEIDELMLESAKQLVDGQMLMTLHSMSVQMRELGNTNIADQMMTLLLTSLDAEKRPDVSLCAIEQLRRMKDPRADRLLNQVMKLPMADQVPGLWRFASKLAEDSGRRRLAAERLERAIQLEFATRPTVINIQTVRSDYSELLAKYEELIDASTTLELAPPADLVARIVSVADQWRTLDEDDTAACQTASRLLSKLNSKEIAWDYLTTPLADNSGESGPWIALARSLGTDTQTDLASMAWAQAFELESTNPEILLEHALLLQAAGRFEPAKALLKRAIDSTWQPRFAGTVQQCRDRLRLLQQR